jgi:4'-phosphopantetheinyl transferase
MTPIEREPPLHAAFDLAIARCTVAAGLTLACATVSDRIAPATQSALERLLDDDEKAAYVAISDHDDRRCYAAARGLLRIEISMRLQLSPQDWQYVPRSGGRPEIRTPLGRIDNLRFSLSHTRGVVACAVADSSAGPWGSVGIDVEWVRSLPDMDRLARDHFAEAELRALRALPAPQRPARFFSLWTLRQAWGKARCGVRAPLEDHPVFGFDETGTIPHATFSPGMAEINGRWRFWLQGFDDQHVVALAARQHQLLT